MNIYEIDKAIEELIASSIDPETGELVIEDDTLDNLQMERTAKVENLALYIKNNAALAAGIRQEEASLADRRRAIERKVDRLKRYLDYVLNGQKFTTEKVSCTFRKSDSVEIAPEFIEWAAANDASLLRMKEPEADKTAIKKLLKDGAEIPFASLVTKQSLTIK